MTALICICFMCAWIDLKSVYKYEDRSTFRIVFDNKEYFFNN